MSSEIKVLNSISRKKETLTHQDDKLTWYGCGPTVYDSPHLGHARTYVSFDIIRRILVHYFNLNVTYCMNITDIDDKIIRRARQQYLMREYKVQPHSRQELLRDVTSANKVLGERVVDETDPLKKEIFQEQFARNQAHIEQFSREVDSADDLLENCDGVLSEYLDLQQGHTVNDNELFFDLPRRYEEEFFAKMDLLGVMRPDLVTRVTEFVPQIVDYIQTIMSNGYAYVARSGSVYFDVPGFSTHHTYARLVPESAGDAKSLAEGEGSLTTGEGEKRSARDFALWKASKEGEPAWDSPWGKGRPGWHIECSAMATCAFGPQMDLHSGGHDLKFPHHDNELAQAEAYFNGGCWVRYFLHSGHLTINGCKMSKSLKNFITIESALQETSPRRMRLLFLLHVWNQPFDYSADALNEAFVCEKQIIEFLLTAKSYCRNGENRGDSDFSPVILQQTRDLFRQALCDSFNTRQAMNELKSLMSSVNTFMHDNVASPTSTDAVRDAANFVIDSLKLFGLVESDSLDVFTVFKTALSAETIVDDLSPFIGVIGKAFDVFSLNVAKISSITNDIRWKDCDSTTNGDSDGNGMHNWLVLEDTIKLLLEYIENEMNGLGDLFLSVGKGDPKFPISIVADNVTALREKAGKFTDFESMAYDYVKVVSRVRDRFRYDCISLIKLTKLIRKNIPRDVTPDKLREVDERVKLLLGHCDVVRKDLMDLGVKLEDFSGGTPATIKFYDLDLIGI